MQAAVLAILLLAVLGFLFQPVRTGLRTRLLRTPALLFAAPVLLAGVFCAVAAGAGVLTAPLGAAVFAYVLVPTACAFAAGIGPAKRPVLLDFAVILLLWLPMEFSAGAALVPRPQQGYLHSVAYGIAILLALVIFLVFRAAPGMKYNLPRHRRDWVLPLAGFLLCAPVLIAAGIALDFIPWFHRPPNHSQLWMLGRFLLIFAATGLPEEILFRSLIQNFLMLRFGSTNSVLAVASLIFGCAHLNNRSYPLHPLPNWRYMILAAIAGFAYGKVFQKSSTVLSSAGLHGLVDATKHFFF